MNHGADPFFSSTIIGTIVFGFLMLAIACKRPSLVNASSLLNTMGLCLTCAALNYSSLGSERLASFLLILIIQNLWISVRAKSA